MKSEYEDPSEMQTLPFEYLQSLRFYDAWKFKCYGKNIE